MRRTEIRFDCGLAHSFLPNFVRNNNFVARSEIDTGDTRHDRQRAIDGKCRDTCWAISTRQRILKYLKWSFRLELTPLVWAEPAKWAGDHFARQFNGSYTQEQCVKFHWNRICTIYSTAVWAKTDRRTSYMCEVEALSLCASSWLFIIKLLRFAITAPPIAF